MMYGAPINFKDFIFKILVPVTLGNIVGGAVCVGKISICVYECTQERIHICVYMNQTILDTLAILRYYII
jgi:hypothetical protein